MQLAIDRRTGGEARRAGETLEAEASVRIDGIDVPQDRVHRPETKGRERHGRVESTRQLQVGKPGQGEPTG